MSSDVNCQELRGIGAELALGVLPGRERAGAVAHLDRCADCREYVQQLTQVGDRLIGLLPGSEPPVGFETRVAQALKQLAAAHEGRPHARASSLRAGPFGRLRPRLAAAGAALVLAIGFGGWSVGTAIEATMAQPAAPAGGQTGMLWGGLTSAQAAVGRPAGEVYAHPGAPGWVYMSVDLSQSGSSYSGKVSCLLVRKDGGTVRVGSFTLHRGQGSWGAPASVDPGTLAGARVTATDGHVLAGAHFATGAET
ncbi:hypothetical protein [Streptomyces anandii]|uniref:hypothetical protein n=1 Tax=Streptomyces anandii TaxID=285454 RepID=UPI00167498F0|nr:hypothetical protein [Streptomyces anandii]GGX92476.1 hypothetical protein GCM10010510_42000 [Streptomyces anandii JCM 4720]